MIRECKACTLTLNEELKDKVLNQGFPAIIRIQARNAVTFIKGTKLFIALIIMSIKLNLEFTEL